MQNVLMRAFWWMTSHWPMLLVACALGIVATCKTCLNNDETRAQRLQRRQEKRIRALADRISTYGRKVHQRYPTGDVVVGQCDLAEQLGENADAVVTVLNLLVKEQKVQRASLAGYWKLNA
jgi:hypothetical protein